MTTALRRVERALFDGLPTDELVQLLLFEIEQLVIAGRHCVHELVLHVEIGYREHCTHTTNTRVSYLDYSYLGLFLPSTIRTMGFSYE